MSRCSPPLKWRLVIPIGLLLANLVVVTLEVSWLRLLAGLILLFIWPGLAWLQALNWLETQCAVERFVLVGGLSVTLASLATLGAVYWPGPWTLTTTLVWLDLVTLLGFVVGFLAWSRPKVGTTTWPSPRIVVALSLVLLIALFLRWYAIGYGEFHEDALENMRLAVRAMGGEEYAPFLDSKGPVHWLLPGSLWQIHGWVTEGIARSTFAVSSTLTVLAVYIWGRRMAGPVVGVIAGGFVAVNGFFVAYARFVENPSLIVFWGVLAAWCAYRFYTEGMGALLVLGGLFLSIGMVSHPDVLLYLPPFGYMIAATYWREKSIWRRYWKSTAASMFVFVTVCLIFYVPFVLDPNFQRTQEYFAAERIGTQFLYNRVANMLEQDRLYSTRFYAPLLILFSGVLIIRELGRLGRAGLLLGILFSAAAVSTIYVPSVWELGGVNLAFLPYLSLFLLLALSTHTSFEVKSLVLWFGVPFLALQFLAKDAADHIQIAYPAWSLLAALGLHFLWNRALGIRGRILKVTVAAALISALGLIIFYQYLQFLGSVVNYWKVEADAKYNPTSIYRTLYGELPRPRKLFGNPRLGGWKVVGYLYDAGQLKGDFRSINESFAVPIWYTHQTPRSCFNDPQNYFVRNDPRGEPEEMGELLAAGYGLTRIVQVDQQPMLYLFEKGLPSSDQPAVFDVDDYRRLYDHSATVARYIQGRSPEQELHMTFGNKLVLRGYDMVDDRVKPGDTLALTLHWQAIAPMNIRYRAFVHVETDRIWGQHDDDPVCRVRTDEWRPPQAGIGQFRVTLDPATPPGTYPVFVGVYNPENWERLEIVDEGEQPVGNSFLLTTISVE